MKRSEVIPAFIAKVAAGIERCSDMPVPDDWAELLEEVLTVRGGSFRLLQNPRKGSSDRSVALLKLIGWHLGRNGSSLWGPMSARWYCDGAEDFDRITNLATIAGIIGSGRSVGAETWRKALGGSAS